MTSKIKDTIVNFFAWLGALLPALVTSVILLTICGFVLYGIAHTLSSIVETAKFWKVVGYIAATLFGWIVISLIWWGLLNWYEWGKYYVSAGAREHRESVIRIDHVFEDFANFEDTQYDVTVSVNHNPNPDPIPPIGISGIERTVSSMMNSPTVVRRGNGTVLLTNDIPEPEPHPEPEPEIKPINDNLDRLEVE